MDLATFQEHLNLNTASVFLAIKQALASFEKLSDLQGSSKLYEVGLDEPDVFLAVEVQDDDEKWLVEDGVAAEQLAQPTKPNFGGGPFSSKPTTHNPTVKYKSRDGAPSISVTSSAVPSAPTAGPSRMTTRSQTGASSRQPGLTGLNNLGNTCVCRLACLCHTPLTMHSL